MYSEFHSARFYVNWYTFRNYTTILRFNLIASSENIFALFLVCACASVVFEQDVCSAVISDVTTSLFAPLRISNIDNPKPPPTDPRLLHRVLDFSISGRDFSLFRQPFVFFLVYIGRSSFTFAQALHFSIGRGFSDLTLLYKSHLQIRFLHWRCDLSITTSINGSFSGITSCFVGIGMLIDDF